MMQTRPMTYIFRFLRTDRASTSTATWETATSILKKKMKLKLKQTEAQRQLDKGEIMADYRKLTILHSNDMHGDFLAENIDDNLVGGVSMLSGYLNKVRNEDPEALYVIAGDMFRGSIIDAEYQGVSTIEIMNYLAPDVVTLGNHEVDYGMAHLLFLEKCCKFPIVNANLYIKTTGTRIFNSHKVLRAAGMNILFIGIITEEIMACLLYTSPSPRDRG